jgi:hypothetical protein
MLIKKYKRLGKHKYKNNITLKKIKQVFNDRVIKHKYSIPSKLYDKIESLIQVEYNEEYISESDREYKKYETKLEQALYLCLAILHLNYDKNLELNEFNLTTEEINSIKYTFDVKIGCQLSKTILTSIISNKDLYKVKRIINTRRNNPEMYLYITLLKNQKLIINIENIKQLYFVIKIFIML